MADKYAVALKDSYEECDALRDKLIAQQEKLELLQKQLDDAQKSSTLGCIIAGIDKDSKIRRFLTPRRLFKKPLEYGKPVYDAEAYKKYNSDIAAIYGKSPRKLLRHFINQGMYEGRRASERFDIKAYLKYNADVAELYADDLRSCYIHFCENGMKEGRRGI